MRRRRDPNELPPELYRFEGFRHSTAAAWESAFDEFWAAREAWAAERGIEGLLLFEVDGECPFDGSLI